MKLFHSRFSTLRVSLHIMASCALAAALLFSAISSHVSPVLAAEDPPVFLAKWGSQGSDNGQFNHPWYVSGDSLGHIYVVENSSRVQKFNRAGVFIENWWGGPATPFGFSPRGIAVDPEDNVYVSDTSNNRIQKFSSGGDFITTWGTEGEADGQFKSPHGIAVAPDGSVYVADELNNRVQKFIWNEDDEEYKHSATWGGTATGSALGDFVWPKGVAVDTDGNVYVADWGNHRVQKFDGVSWTLFVGQGGSGPGQFNNPRGVAADSDGNIYVGDTNNHRIQKFNSAGGFLVSWGTEGAGDGQFSYPSGVWVRDDKDIYVADTGGNHRIQVFGYYPTVDIELEAGWNMVSVPVQHPLSMATANLFAGTRAVYGWNRESQSYFTPSTIEVDHGYWVSVTSEQTITIPGTLQQDWSSTVMAGWNMVGSISQEMLFGDLVPDSGDPLLTSSVYWWNPSEREFVPLDETDVLEPGKAYWLASTADCTVTLGPPEPV